MRPGISGQALTSGSVPGDESYPPEKLVSYDPVWAERFAVLRNDLTRALGAEWRVEHVGSTSVPGLVAKPVIDLAVSVPAGRDLPAAVDAFLDLGWVGPAETGDHEAFFLYERGVRSAIAHVFTAAQWPCAHVRLFAAWLRSHAEDRENYAAVKRGLVAHGTWGRDYTEAKRAFVQDVVNRARSARGLGPVTL